MEAILTKILIQIGLRYAKQIITFVLVLFLLIFIAVSGVYIKPEKIESAVIVNAVNDTKRYKGLEAVTIQSNYSLKFPELEYAFPSTGTITQKVKTVGYSGHPHLAWDIAKNGDKVPIYAVVDGKVTVSKINTQHTNYQWRFCSEAGGICYDKISEFKDIVFGCGNEIQIESNSVETLKFMYCHLEQRLVEVGQTVKMGDVIGYMGQTGWATGKHLHFTVYYKGDAVDPKYFYEK